MYLHDVNELVEKGSSLKSSKIILQLNNELKMNV